MGLTTTAPEPIPTRIVHHTGVASDVVPVRPTDGSAFTTPGTVFDQDTGGGTQNVVGVSLRAPASGGSVELAKAEDVAHATGDQGIVHLAVRKDSPDAISLSSADGDYAIPVVNKKGKLWVHPTNVDEEWYFYTTPVIALTAIAANKPFFSMFNADIEKIVRVRFLTLYSDIPGSTTGINVSFDINRTTAVHVGGTALTAWLADTGDTALDADITAAWTATTFGTPPTLSSLLKRFSIHTEETAAAATNPNPQLMAGFIENNLIPSPLALSGKGIVCRQNQGIAISEVDRGAAEAGNMYIIAGFTVE